MPETRINQDDFIAAPREMIIGVLDTDVSPDDFLAGVRDSPLDTGRVSFLQGQEGRAIVDAAGEHHGLKGRLVRAAQVLTDETDLLHMAREALESGRTVVRVDDVDDDEAPEVESLLSANGVVQVHHFGTWTSR